MPRPSPSRRSPPRAKRRWRRPGCAPRASKSALNDQVEGGAVPIDGESGIAVMVRHVDGEEARRILDTGAGG